MLYIDGKYYSRISDFHNPTPFTRPEQLTERVLYYLDDFLSKRGGSDGSYDRYHVALLVLKGAPKIRVVAEIIYIMDGGREIDIRRLFATEEEALKHLPDDRHW